MGSKSLLEEFSTIAEEAYDWNPNNFSSHSGRVMAWRCSLCKHIWPARISHRTDPNIMSGCPSCEGKQTESLLISCPELSSEAFQWNSNLYTSGSNSTLVWLCKNCQTKWEASPKQRIKSPLAWGCPECYGQVGKYQTIYGQTVRVPKKSHSLAVRYPNLSKELVEPEMAKLISYGSQIVVPWYCATCDKIWEAQVNNRTSHHQGCPSHAKNGYKVNEPGVLYFLLANRKGCDIVKYGITKNVKQRIAYHRRNGFKVPENSYFLKFANGKDALAVETSVRKALLKKGIPSIKDDLVFEDNFKGFSESFRKELLSVVSLGDLLKVLGIEIIGMEHEWVEVLT